MDIEWIVKNFSIAAGTITASIAALSAAQNWIEKAKDSKRIRNEKRQQEILRLQTEFKEVEGTFIECFDYESHLDDHLRVTNLDFQEDELITRSKVDAAFEHLRNVHRSVVLALIEKDDIAPWVYWIHRVSSTRPPLERYAKACGYCAFLDDLKLWTLQSKELQELIKYCPWWTGSSQAIT